ncbi:MAG: aminoacyl-tRNA deacylase [Ancalomicrobiaceae bacterium]|nr:aminoacyl-tRNA deacylase [Ancalomicrobiaceae bacterium]
MPATPATQFLKAKQIAFDLLEYQHDPRAEAYALEAVDKLGLAASSVFKTLVVSDESAPARHALVLVPAAEKLSLSAAAKALSWKRAAMAKPADAQRLTGYVLGGISAFGTKKPLPVVVDDSLVGQTKIHLSGGRRGLEIGLAPGDLIASLSALVAPICA